MEAVELPNCLLIKCSKLYDSGHEAALDGHPWGRPIERTEGRFQESQQRPAIRCAERLGQLRQLVPQWRLKLPLRQPLSSM